MSILILFVSKTFFLPQAYAAELYDVKFDDSLEWNHQKMILNSLGLRKAFFVGFPVKVYVAGFYLTEKTHDPQKIIQSEKPQVLILKFKRTVDKEKIVKGWNEAYSRNCLLNCENDKELLKKFNAIMVDMKKESEIRLEFTKGQLQVFVQGREKKTNLKLESDSFGKNVLSMFVGEKVEDKGLRKGLLGL